MTLQDYLSLFPGASREKSRFMALAEAVLRQVLDLQAAVSQINQSFSLEEVQGTALDSIAVNLLDTSRAMQSFCLRAGNFFTCL